MAEPTSTFLSSAEQCAQSSIAQRRLKLAIQLTGVVIGLGAAYGILGLAIDHLPARKIILPLAIVLAPIWVAIRWTFYGRAIRGGIYAFAVPSLVLTIEWIDGPVRMHDPGFWFFVPLAMVGIHFVTVALVARLSGVRLAATARQAAWRAVRLVGFGSLWATTLVAGTMTLCLLWYTFVLGRANAAWSIGLAWIIAAVLTAGLTLWAGFLGAVYHLREVTSRPPLWRTWRGVKLLIFFGILFTGLASLAARPFLAARAIRAAGGEVEGVSSYERLPVFGVACGVTAESDAFDPRSLSQVRHLYLDTVVKLASPAIDDAAIEHLRDAPNVYALELASPNLSDRSFEVLDSLHSLVWLRIAGTRITGSELASVGSYRLKRLDIDGAPFTREAFSAIGQFGLLEHLRLANVHLEESDVRAFADLWYLEELTFENVSLGKDALRPLEEFRAPRLSLWIVGLEPSDLPQLAWCPQLSRLDLSNTNVTDADLVHLQGSRQLDDLDLSNTSIRGSGLRYLTRLPRLREVRLVETPLADSEILVLAGMPRTEFAFPETTSPFAQALLQYEQARVKFAEGKIDDREMRAAEREFRNQGEHPGDLLDNEEEDVGVVDDE